MLSFFRETAGIHQLTQKRFQVIFYAETAGYFQYFQHLFDSLQAAGVKMCYLTSQKNDPVFERANANTEVVYSKSTLAFAFPRLQADVMIMTMPDLEKFIFKKSASVGKYIYVFHALVSTHQQYRKGAFDHYDTIFLAGPHHEKEIKETEQLYNLPSKTLIHYGYPLLQELQNKRQNIPVIRDKILLAPSWYEEGIFQTCLQPVLDSFRLQENHLAVRPHPEFIKRNKQAFAQLKKIAAKYENISIDLQPSLWESLLSSEYLITDRSGIALEYALVNKKPAVLIDTALKIQNKESDRLMSAPVENIFRDRIGIPVAVNEIHLLPEILKRMKKEQESFVSTINAVENKITYPEPYLTQGVTYILGQLS